MVDGEIKTAAANDVDGDVCRLLGRTNVRLHSEESIESSLMKVSLIVWRWSRVQNLIKIASSVSGDGVE